MIHGARVCVTVPAFDEERLIARTLASIPSEVDRIIVVDDASRDGTLRVLEGIADARLEIVRREKNGGVGAAIASGYERFLAGEGDLCVVMAGDAQMDPEDLPDLVRPVATGRADYAKGNRLVGKDVLTVMPRDRFFGNVVFTMLTKVASGYWHVVDSQCGYTAVTRQALEQIDLDRLYPRYGFPNDFLIKLNVTQARVCDVPVRAIYGEEVSGITPWTTIPRISWLLFRGFVWRLWQRHVLRDFHPLVLLYVFGAFFLGLGLLGGLWIAAIRLFTPTVVTTPTVILNALCLLVGVQAILFAMTFDMLHNGDLKVRP
ncbi:MAG: glycosyltransferase family 2 protein [Planctomycetes bacterium]|nr:glycosyltransferase family 2 protein [Planctomycetota bacterium]